MKDQLFMLTLSIHLAQNDTTIEDIETDDTIGYAELFVYAKDGKSAVEKGMTHYAEQMPDIVEFELLSIFPLKGIMSITKKGFDRTGDILSSTTLFVDLPIEYDNPFVDFINAHF